MKELCDSDLIKFHVNGEHTFFLNQRIVSKYSGKLKKMMNQENRGPQIEIDDFPGGAEAFELVSRFCYNNGRIQITSSNVSVLHCSATFLEMTEKLSSCNLLHQTETFLDGLFYWSWNDVLLSLKSCENFFSTAESSGLVHKLISSLLSRISQNSDSILSSSSSSSPESSGFRFSSSTNKTTPTSDFAKPGSPTKAWWFEDLTILGPKIVEKIIKTMGCFGTENHNLVLTKFLLHYLKTTSHTKNGNGYGSKLCSEYTGLADTAIHGVVLMGKTSFSCRGLFWVLRMVSALGLSKDCRDELERLIGGMLEKATLDDVLVSGHKGGGVYDVNLVLRLVKVFVSGGDGVSGQRMKKVGRLIDKYMGEIAPDQKLKVSKFLSVAESLPDSARDCFDGMYRAIDIYLESHRTLCFDDRSKLCRCLNYEKLTLEACKDLAKNPLIPPRIAIQALIAQKPKVMSSGSSSLSSPTAEEAETENTLSEYSEDSEEMKMNLAKMQWRVMELEKVCMEMKGQMSKMVKNKVMSSTSPVLNRTLPRLC